MKVLFVGNSFQYASNVSWDYSSDGSFVQLAEAAGKTIDWKGTYIGGAVLSQHWNDNDSNNVRDQLANGDYDLVVINGGNGGNDPAVAAQLADLAKANGTEVMFFDLWAPDYQISVSGGDGFDYVHKIYEKMATDNDAAYSPVGRAYAAVYAEVSKMYGKGDDGQTAENMLTYDGIHATPMTGYMAGLVMYGTVYGTRPPPPSVYLPKGVSLADANMIYDIAWKTVQQYAIYVDSGPTTPVTTGTVSGRMFLDANKDGIDDTEGGVAGVTVYLWEEGVGIVATTKTAANGSYTFTGVEAGNYRVRFADPAADKSFTTGNVGSDSADSDVGSVLSTGEGVTHAFAVTAGKTVSNISAGIKQDATSGGTPPTTGISTDPKDYDTVRNGGNGAESLRGSTPDDYINAGGGNDFVNGGAGNDLIIGGAGSDTLMGGDGADAFIFDRTDARINGGAGVDTILFRAAAATDARNVAISSVEVFDLVNSYKDNVTFSFRQLRGAKDDELMIKADAGDVVRIDTTHEAKLLGTFTEGGQTYERYVIGEGSWAATFAIDADAQLYVGGVLI